MTKNLLVLTLIFLTTIINLQAQKKEGKLNISQKKKIVFFLINAHQFETDTSEWKKYLDAIEYEQIYSNRQATNKLYAFSSTSFHALTFFFIKQGSNEVFLDSKYSKANIKILMNFFMRDSRTDSKTLLKSISKIIDVYQLNETSGSKIPVAPN